MYLSQTGVYKDVMLRKTVEVRSSGNGDQEIKKCIKYRSLPMTKYLKCKEQITGRVVSTPPFCFILFIEGASMP